MLLLTGRPALPPLCARPALPTSGLRAAGERAAPTIKANQSARQADITALENATNTTDPSQLTELAVLQRINRALLLQLRTMQDTNQINANAALQQMVIQKQQQDAIKASFRDSSGYQNFYKANVTTSSGAANLLTQAY